MQFNTATCFKNTTNKKMKVAVLLTAFNRKNTTLKCLRSFFPLCNELVDYFFDVFMTDDGCTDGTPDAVKAEFPQINIVPGDGTLFWSGGMRTAWDAAAKHDDYDYYLWLNDDINLYPHALKEIFQMSVELNDNTLICGAFCNTKGEFTYGGCLNDNTRVIPNGEPQDVFFTNGNLLLIPKTIYSVLGNIPKYFRHDGGDNDYGLRSIEHGFRVVTTLSYLGECANNPKNKYGKGRKMGVSFWKRFRYLYSPFGVNPNMVFRYNLSHFGLKKAIYTYLGLLYNTMLPDSWYIKKHESKIKKITE